MMRIGDIMRKISDRDDPKATAVAPADDFDTDPDLVDPADVGDKKTPKVIVPASGGAKPAASKEPDPSANPKVAYHAVGVFYVVKDGDKEEAFYTPFDYEQRLQKQIADSGIPGVDVESLLVLQADAGVVHADIFYLDNDGQPVTTEPVENPALVHALMDDYELQRDPEKEPVEVPTVNGLAAQIKKLSAEDQKAIADLLSSTVTSSSDEDDED